MQHPTGIGAYRKARLLRYRMCTRCGEINNRLDIKKLQAQQQQQHGHFTWTFFQKQERHTSSVTMFASMCITSLYSNNFFHTTAPIFQFASHRTATLPIYPSRTRKNCWYRNGFFFGGGGTATRRSSGILRATHCSM